MLVIPAAVCVAALQGCSTESSESTVQVHLNRETPVRLSSYRFFVGRMADFQPNEGVVPYDLNTPLFSDYTHKRRFVWIPPGSSAAYAENGPLELPIGTVVVKTFSYLNDMGDPSAGERIIETRLLVRTASGWEPRVYVWNEAQTEAELDQAGSIFEANWVHSDGESKTNRYIIPDANKCKSCHVTGKTVTLIGLKAANLNRDYDYAEGRENQLDYWARVGALSGLPSVSQVQKLPVWDDSKSYSPADRARAWLDVQCAHCHNPEGPARTSALDLRYLQVDPIQFGVCKPPVAAGRGAGDKLFDIVPGRPDDSILVFRIESTEPGIQMPELPIKLVHQEGAALVREWITGLSGSCK